jgi:hypothetical protein
MKLSDAAACARHALALLLRFPTVRPQVRAPKESTVQAFYPTEVLPGEGELGFHVAEVPDPGAELHGRSETVRAVVYEHDAVHRLVKTSLPRSEGSYYQVQTFGVHRAPPFTQPDPRAPRWLSVGTLCREGELDHLAERLRDWLLKHQDPHVIPTPRASELVVPAGDARPRA